MITSKRFGGALPVQEGRYHLFVSPVCPWCRRVSIARRILGLEEAISISESTGKGKDGFLFEGEDGFDPILRVRTAREMYWRQVDWEVGEATSVPALVDLSAPNTPIVANESADLLIDLATVWRPLHKEGAPDLYPEKEREKLAGLDEQIHQNVNSQFYPIAHREDEEQAQAAIEKICAYLHRVDPLLAQSTYLTGEQVRGSDIRLFTTLEGLASVVPFASTLRGAFADTPNVARYFRHLCAQDGWVSDLEAKVLHLN